MIPGVCIEIHTRKFPVLDGEDDEIVNEGMYGKALCRHLERELPAAGLAVPLFLCEDWGWWIEVQDGDFVLGLQIYSDSEPGEDPPRYAILSSVTANRKWSWRRFRREEMTGRVTAIMDRLERLFIEDPEIDRVLRHDEFPF